MGGNGAEKMDTRVAQNGECVVGGYTKTITAMMIKATVANVAIAMPIVVSLAVSLMVSFIASVIFSLYIWKINVR